MSALHRRQRTRYQPFLRLDPAPLARRGLACQAPVPRKVPEGEGEEDEKADEDGDEGEADLGRVELAPAEDDGVRVEETVEHGVDDWGVSIWSWSWS